jgi:hypothetical protein
LALLIGFAATNWTGMPGWLWYGLLVFGALIIVGTVVGVVYAVLAGTGGLRFMPSSRVSGVLRSESRSVEAVDAELVHTEIEMKEGSLRLMGGASAALEGTFNYDDADWKEPRIEYRTDEKGHGYLAVRQESTNRLSARQGPCDWAIRLNNALPTDLSVRMATGEGDLRFGDLNLSNLSVESGIGTLTVDLSGRWLSSLGVYIESGIGKVTVLLPAETGVRVQVGVAMGSLHAGPLLWDDNSSAYVNEAYGKSPILLNITVDGSMGQIEMEQRSIFDNWTARERERNDH